jgi:hypothetical protein
MLCEPMTPLFVGDFFNAIDPKRTAAKVCPDHRAHTSEQTKTLPANSFAISPSMDWPGRSCGAR